MSLRRPHSWSFLSPSSPGRASRGAGRCECVSPFPSNGCQAGAYHGSSRGWPLTCGVTPSMAASPGGLCVTLTPHQRHPSSSSPGAHTHTHTDLLTHSSISHPLSHMRAHTHTHTRTHTHLSQTIHTFWGTAHAEVKEWKKKWCRNKRVKKGRRRKASFTRLCHLFLSTIDQGGSPWPDTILFLQMSAVMSELISRGWGGTGRRTHCIAQIRGSLCVLSAESGHCFSHNAAAAPPTKNIHKNAGLWFTIKWREYLALELPRICRVVLNILNNLNNFTIILNGHNKITFYPGKRKGKMSLVISKICFIRTVWMWVDQIWLTALSFFIDWCQKGGSCLVWACQRQKETWGKWWNKVFLKCAPQVALCSFLACISWPKWTKTRAYLWEVCCQHPSQIHWCPDSIHTLSLVVFCVVLQP